MPANGRATVEFAPLDVEYGFNRCEVRIEGGDAFPADDASVFAVRRSDPERVLFVHAAGDTRSAALLRRGTERGGAGFIRLAIRSAEQTTGSRSIQVRLRRAVGYGDAALDL